MTPHSAYVWHLLHCRCHRIHSITMNHSIYDDTSTSGMTSHPRDQTLHPLYLCHHNISTDITPTFEWHHTHLLCDIICLYITSHPILLSSHCCTYDITNSVYETTSSMYGNIYTIHETSQPLSVSSHPLYRQHHTHSLYDITITIYVASFALYKTSHPHFMTSNHGLYVITTTILDTVSTVSVSPHLLYWWYHTNCISEIRYNSQHHIHSIGHDTHCTTSQPLHSWHQFAYIWYQLQRLWYLIPYTCDITETMFVNTCQLYFTTNTRC